MSLKRVPVGRVKGLAEVEQKGWKSTVGQSGVNGEIRGHRCMCVSCQCEYVCVCLCTCVYMCAYIRKNGKLYKTTVVLGCAEFIL